MASRFACLWKVPDVIWNIATINSKSMFDVSKNIFSSIQNLYDFLKSSSPIHVDNTKSF